MSDEVNKGGELNLFVSRCELCLSARTLSSGDADRLGRWLGVAGPAISTGGARELWES